LDSKQAAATIRVQVTERQRDLLCASRLAPDCFTEELRAARSRGGLVTATIPVSTVDTLLGWIAGEANHTSDRQYEDELDEVYLMLEDLVSAATRKRSI
jgi:hypothetical protein